MKAKKNLSPLRPDKHGVVASKAVEEIANSYEDKLLPGSKLTLRASDEPRASFICVFISGEDDPTGPIEEHVWEYTGHGAIHGAIHGYSYVSRRVHHGSVRAGVFGGE